MDILLIVGLILGIVGVYKIKYVGQYLKGFLFLIIGMAIMYAGFPDKDAEYPEKITQEIKQEIKQEAAEQVIEQLDQQQNRDDQQQNREQ